ncbi:flagellar basal body P-ring biosynthesis protein FlgA [Caulifigura coniformis]|uniref:Flagellar basal body P-ring biosynthesis protein FlgA n=1 Tax=Caulifigura coniformis TaxID=2527983 RepID=A0A517SJC5_9PLAN|nr:flagellar basal body P-ring formation chaperone FlgA [Caulifigura coniformis]QDT56230.1 flagellar basal body P-ring biosynthesis protein FlgA [Caulifigura coniformis]
MIGAAHVARMTVLAVILLAFAGQQVRAQTAIVHLRSSAKVDRDVMMLGDIADITASSAALERRLKGLDLLDRQSSGASEIVSSRHVQARVLLEGIDHKTVTLVGADECQVSFAAGGDVVQVAATRGRAGDDLMTQAVQALAKAWMASPDDVEVQFLSTPSEQLKPVPGAIPELELPTRVEPGRVQARIRWVGQNRIERIDSVTFEARLRQTVVLATHRIERGAPIRLQDIVEDRRLMANRVEQVRAEQVVGYVARRGLSQGDMVTAKDLAVQKTAPAIQARNGVKVTARKGKLSVTLQMAEALEAGNVGDVIRLRNLQSGQIITGRVVSNQEVEIPLD